MSENNAASVEKIYGRDTAWRLDEVTWCISFMEGSEYLYLLEGEEKALLLDTGYGIGKLRAFVEKLTEKPVIVANTHFHPDHSAGNGEWESVLVSQGWAVDAPSVNNPGAGPCDLSTLPHPDYEKVIVRDGDVVDLGGRKITVWEAAPAHCNSSLFFVDEGHKMLFAGDEFESQQTLLYDNSCNPDAPYHVEKRLENLRSNGLRLRSVCGEGWYLLPNHNGTPISIAYLDEYVALVDAIYSGTAVIEDKLNHRYIEMDPKAPELCRVRRGSVSIFIKKQEVLKVYGKTK
jgi:glyoxylase-like metal-dependent hydrolase (beta-lactamase superfamily II)